MPVTQTFSDLDTYKGSEWTNRTNSSNSLTSIRAQGPSDSDAQSYPMPSAEYLQSEIVRLRQQLQLSREDAARAANRLSQQETELAQLRHMLENMRTKPVGSIVPAQHAVTRKSALNSTGRVRTEASPQSGFRVVSGSNANQTVALNRKPTGDSQLVRNSGPPAAPAPAATTTGVVTTTTTTTFEELDDAMAK
ncbi:hypothetical protein FGIG_04791 [Fasciola gigantica]|uniref:Uncharacterized protein n=1 Tax=Fasciola gigantica TaxID=46835 RepID=A0A504YVE0_FASGI|nr:hypothetical protein FGIG_04791 [Fasciola gigantica]